MHWAIWVMIDEHASRTPCSFGSGMFICIILISWAQVLISAHSDDWHYGTQEERTPDLGPAPGPLYYTRAWQPRIIIKCESANKLSSRPGRKYKIIDLTGAHINYVRSEVHNNKRGTLVAQIWSGRRGRELLARDWLFTEDQLAIHQPWGLYVSGLERFFMQSIAHFSLWLEMQQDPNCSCHTLRGNLLGVFKGCFEDLTAFEEMSSPVKSPGLWIETLQCAR